MTNKLKEVREAIIAAVPGIMKLEFGCEVKTTQRGMGKMFYLGHYDGPGHNWLAVYPEKWSPVLERPMYSFGWEKGCVMDWEILGRKIGIADVMRALSEKKFLEHPDGGRFVARNFYMNAEGQCTTDTGLVLCSWNLSTDDLSAQSEECVAFIHSILCK
jgi:hypothetical protein